jgi:hypothetical protein
MLKGSELSNPYRRRQFFALGVATFVALLAVRFFILPWLWGQHLPSAGEIVDKILDGFLVAIATSMITAAVLSWLTPSEEMAEIMIMNPGIELKRLLENDLRGTRSFWYKGHTGKWTRSETLPRLAREARATRSTKDIRIVILNPNNDGACRQLANLDAERDPKVDTSSQVSYIKKQLLATVLAAYVWREKEPLLQIAVALHNEFSLFRIDLTDQSAIVTRSSPRDLAIRYSFQSDFYRSFLEEVRVSFNRSKRLREVDARGIDINRLTEKTARDLLAMLELDPAEVLGVGEDALADVIKMVREDENRYPD